LHSFVVLCETNILSLVSQNLDNFYQIQTKYYRNSDTVFFFPIRRTKRGLLLNRFGTQVRGLTVGPGNHTCGRWTQSSRRNTRIRACAPRCGIRYHLPRSTPSTRHGLHISDLLLSQNILNFMKSHLYKIIKIYVAK
jgi:hypothetical protein